MIINTQRGNTYVTSILIFQVMIASVMLKSLLSAFLNLFNAQNTPIFSGYEDIKQVQRRSVTLCYHGSKIFESQQ